MEMLRMGLGTRMETLGMGLGTRIEMLGGDDHRKAGNGLMDDTFKQ